MASLQDNDDLLKKIAIAIVENPRSTIKELAEASSSQALRNFQENNSKFLTAEKQKKKTCVYNVIMFA